MAGFFVFKEDTAKKLHQSTTSFHFTVLPMKCFLAFSGTGPTEHKKPLIIAEQNYRTYK
jgi:hypothetical protein